MILTSLLIFAIHPPSSPFDQNLHQVYPLLPEITRVVNIPIRMVKSLNHPMRRVSPETQTMKWIPSSITVAKRSLIVYFTLVSLSPFPKGIELIDGVFTMKCRSCGATNRKDAKFCKQCGSNLSTSYACPRCHFENLPDSAYCTQCGTRLFVQRKPKGTQKRCQSCGYLNDVDAVYCYCCNQKIMEDFGE